MSGLSCADCGLRLDPYLDGELDAVACAAVDSHLQRCAACAAALRQRAALRSALRGLPYHAAPAALRERVFGAVTTAAPRRRLRRALPWLAAVAAAVVAALAVALLYPQQQTQAAFAAKLAEAHLRSLQVDHLTDVTSAETHTVRPWFAGKLAFAPRVPNLAEHGFPLMGGRVDYLDGREVAALVYGRRKHVINLFVWPDHETVALRELPMPAGFNGLQWSAGGLRYHAVSDLNPQDLRRFAELQLAR